METVRITTPYIKLEQFFKLARICQSGGEAKMLILSGKAYVNDEKETRRGRKLMDGDIVSYENRNFLIRRDGGFDGDKTASP
ncbi:MAG: RNA-binding S4 domain-containing protein [Clostridiaceae bacterium]|jgi:ribosome-associated protein|nr:RNA-binding S4 domain-containing protein [Clostridiaceae bacterium]